MFTEVNDGYGFIYLTPKQDVKVIRFEKKIVFKFFQQNIKYITLA